MSLPSHLASGITTVCRAWAIERLDGVVLGFTDHDTDLTFDGIVFSANSSLTASALQQTTGLAVDNTEATGAIHSDGVAEADLLAGRFDGASVRCWLVNWADPAERAMQFRGTVGEIARAGGAFRAELRGLTEALNQPQGRSYQRDCSAILGDRACGFDLLTPGYFAERVVEEVEDRRVFRFADFTGFDDRWFERGRLRVLSGAGTGVIGSIKNDRLTADGREIELWQSLGPDVAAGDILRIEAGCDRLAETCRLKFANFANFRGFPHIPGEDWLASYPTSGSVKDGGSLFR